MSNKLTIEQLKALKEDDWIYIKDLEFGNDFYATVTDTYLGESAKYINIASAGWYQEFWFESYGTEWLAYRNKEEAEGKDEYMTERIEKAYEHNTAECEKCMKKVDIKHQLAMESMKEHVCKETAKKILQFIFGDCKGQEEYLEENKERELDEYSQYSFYEGELSSLAFIKNEVLLEAEKYGVEIDE